MKDNQRCVILYRAFPSKQWELCCIKKRVEEAWKSARGIDDQERILGSKSHKVIVCSEDDYDKGKVKELRPPAGFDFGVEHKAVAVVVRPTDNGQDVNRMVHVPAVVRPQDAPVGSPPTAQPIKPKPDELVKKLSIDEFVDLARKLGVEEETITRIKSRPPGLAKMQFGNLLRKLNG